MSLLAPLLYICVLYGAFVAGSLQLRAQAIPSSTSLQQHARHLPKATLVLLVLIAVPSTLQFFFPPILTTLERNGPRFLAGDWWRLGTSLFVQDGGAGGTIFNLVSLFLVGSLAEQVWGSRRWLVLFFLGGVLSQIIGFWWQPIGAGNSVANFNLAASIAVFCLTRKAQRPVRIAALVALVAGAMLVPLKDIHGAATIFGACIGLGLLWLKRGTSMNRPTCP